MKRKFIAVAAILALSLGLYSFNDPVAAQTVCIHDNGMGTTWHVYQVNGVYTVSETHEGQPWNNTLFNDVGSTGAAQWCSALEQQYPSINPPQ